MDPSTGLFVVENTLGVEAGAVVQGATAPLLVPLPQAKRQEREECVQAMEVLSTATFLEKLLTQGNQGSLRQRTTEEPTYTYDNNAPRIKIKKYSYSYLSK